VPSEVLHDPVSGAWYTAWAGIPASIIIVGITVGGTITTSIAGIPTELRPSDEGLFEQWESATRGVTQA
jgi:hypothetical protein